MIQVYSDNKLQSDDIISSKSYYRLISTYSHSIEESIHDQ